MYGGIRSVNNIVESNSPSVLADRLLCPSLKELEPCVKDPMCTLGTDYGGKQMAAWLQACRVRSRRLTDDPEAITDFTGGDFPAGSTM